MSTKQKKGVKKVGLTDEDKTLINKQMRAGIVVSFSILILGLGSTLTIFFLDKSEPKIIEPGILWILLIGIAVLANGVFMLMNRKYFGDLNDGSKYIETKKIQKKELKKDFEAGSANLHPGQKMKELQSANLIIENTRYEVSKDDFERAEEGGEVLFHYAAKSNFLIKIEVKK